MKKNILKPASMILALGITSVLLVGCTEANNDQPTSPNSSSASSAETKNFEEAEKVVEAYLDAIADGDGEKAKNYLKEPSASNVILDNDVFIRKTDAKPTMNFVFTEEADATSTPTPTVGGTDDIEVETITVIAENTDDSSGNNSLPRIELEKTGQGDWKITAGAYIELTLPMPLEVENAASQQISVNGVDITLSSLPADDDTDGYTTVNVYPSVYKISYTTIIGEKEIKEEVTTTLQSGEEYPELVKAREEAQTAKDAVTEKELEQ